MSSSVAVASNLFDYFNEKVELARVDVATDLNADTGLYLATLLANRARSDATTRVESTLAELHARAANAPPAVQARTYRELGDHALYLLGYFSESLSRRAVGPRYYADMGAAAYHRVDQLFKRWFSDAFGPVFRELADRFPDCIEVLARVRAAQENEPDLIERLYEEWLRTGSEQAATRLRARGLLVPRGANPTPES